MAGLRSAFAAMSLVVFLGGCMIVDSPIRGVTTIDHSARNFFGIVGEWWTLVRGSQAPGSI